MYVTREDMMVLKEREVYDMLMEYRQRFHEEFIAFNYADFQDKDGKIAAQVYKETLAKALADDKPYHIVSHRYDFCDH